MTINHFKKPSRFTPLRWMIGALSFYCVFSIPMGFAATEDDSDGDGIFDVVDNCTKVANNNQRDTDADGYGNVCDGDLDNNGIVNSLDYSAFKARLFGRDANADLNGDGIVNSIDFTLFKRLLLTRPGPGNPSEPSFAEAPPPVSDVQLFKLSQPVNERNAAIAASFDQVVGLKPVISFNFENTTVGLNDLGLEPDAKAADGIYSGYLNHNFEAEEKTTANFQQRLRSVDAKPPVLFSGRDVIGQAAQPITEFAVQPDIQPLIIKTPVDATLVFQPIDTVPILPIAHDAARSLMITHPNVITDTTRTFDPCDVDGDNNQGNVNGAWSFKTLMTNMANQGFTGISAQQFTHNWINKWMSNQTVNSFTIGARPNFQNFFPGWNPANPATLNMNRLPFRLLAIVNRMDLAVSSSYTGIGGQPGETRLVFGLVDVSSCPTHNISPAREMTVIFEYGDPDSDCVSLKSRANEWIQLSTLPIGSPAYNAALQALTDDVTLANSAAGKPNKSAINQVRTNEIVLAFPWQLREFALTPGALTSNLMPTTIKQTPDPGLFRVGSAVTGNFMQTQADAISCERHQVTASHLGQPFLGSHADYAFGTIWHALATVTPGPSFCFETPWTGSPTPWGTVRHKLSLNTCDDCHSGETLTSFTHVKPTTFPTALSSFVQGGIVVSDPGGEIGVSRRFDDLTRRGQILEDLAVKSCRSFIPRRNDPLVLRPRIEPIFKLLKPTQDLPPVNFSRQQQVHTFVH